MPDACLFVGIFGLLEQGGCDMRSGVTAVTVTSYRRCPFLPATAAASAAANHESAIYMASCAEACLVVCCEPPLNHRQCRGGALSKALTFIVALPASISHSPGNKREEPFVKSRV